MTRVYVAGSSLQLERVKAAMTALRTAGHTVTHDWVAAVEAAGSAHPVDATEDQKTAWARDDLRGIVEAEVFWLLMPSQMSFGATFELGYAVCESFYRFMFKRAAPATTTALRVVVSGVWGGHIFDSLVHAQYDRDDHALEAEFGVKASE
jgi:hypothetical protein